MPPLNVLKEIAKPQPLEMEDDYLRENLSQQELVGNGSSRSESDTAVEEAGIGTGNGRPTRTQITTVVILCFVNLINYMDRYTVAGLLYDIKVAFDLSESQMGLLQTAFILVYMIMAPLYGYLGDRFNRRVLMAVGVFLWSLTALLGSFMQSYHWFLIMRCFVGIGEASYSTIAPTLISDMFVSNLRSKMLALFYFAIPVGSGLGYIIGAEVADLAQHILPPEDQEHAWRWGLRVTPFMGLIAVILIIFVLHEPRRGEVQGAQDLKPTSFLNDLKHLFTNQSYILTTLAFTCVTYVAGALAWWGPNYVELGVAVQTDPNVQQGNVSFIFGVIAMIAGLVGVPLGSFAGQRYRDRYPAADPVVCGIGLLLSIPLMVGALLLAGINSWAAFVVVLFGQIFLNLNWAVVSDIVLYICLPTRRSSAEAFQILISHAFGDAGSPYVVGVVAEAFKPWLNSTYHESLSAPSFIVPSTELPLFNTTFLSTVEPATLVPATPTQDFIEFKALQYSLVITTVVEALAAFFFFWAAVYIAKDKEKCDRIISEEKQRDAIKLKYIKTISDTKKIPVSALNPISESGESDVSDGSGLSGNINHGFSCYVPADRLGHTKTNSVQPVVDIVSVVDMTTF